MTNWKDKVVVVAGGSGLIGRAIVKAFKNTGATVINVDINDGDVKVDISIEDVSMMATTIKNISPDIFVNAVYPQTFDNHINAFRLATYAVAKEMAAKNGGSIINLSSIYAVVSPDFRSYEDCPEMGDLTEHADYSFTKGGIIAMSRVVAVYYAPYNVRVNCVSPGGIFDSQPEAFVKSYCNRVPMGRMGVPEDITGAVLFLASDESKYVIGQNLVVDGGLCLR